MMDLRSVFLTLFCIAVLVSSKTFGQNFRSEQKKLETVVNTAYKNKKITSLEYSKLKREQELIRLAIEKSEADGVVTADEKNKIHSKLVRSRKRLAKYKTNREIY
jgi:ATP-dependent protease HslVU (ClpYQ) ATPase subunit